MPEISVIVPVFNAEQYLSRCMDSILAQTLSDFEVILVDDCSFDESGRICDAYVSKYKHINVIHKNMRGGQQPQEIRGCSMQQEILSVLLMLMTI